MFKHILAPIDIEHESSWRRALPIAARLARDHGAALDIITIIPPLGSALVGSFFPPDFEEKVLERARARLADIVARARVADLSPGVHLARGVIYEEVLHAADRLGADLIVMAAHRPELKDYLIGPNSAKVVRHARQSVLVVRD